MRVVEYIKYNHRVYTYIFKNFSAHNTYIFENFKLSSKVVVPEDEMREEMKVWKRKRKNRIFWLGGPSQMKIYSLSMVLMNEIVKLFLEDKKKKYW